MTRLIVLTLLTLFLAASAGQDALAQRDRERGDRERGGRGFGMMGGGGFGAPDLLREVRDSTFQTELKLTDEQKQKLEALNESRPNPREAMGDVFERMRNAADDAEREAIGAEMRAAMQKMAAESEAKIKEVLQPEQFTRLQQISLQRQGTRAFMQESVANDLKLTDDQKAKMAELGTGYFEAMRGLGFSASPEDREKLRLEWDAKYQAVLTPEQQTQWKTRLGAPLAATSTNPGTPGAPGTTPPAPAVPRVVRVEEVPAGAVPVLSFGAGAPAQSSATAATPANPGDQPASSEKKTPVSSLSFNFKYAPWADVLKMFADAAGLSLDLNDVPPGTFSYYDQKSYTPMEALDILNGYLLPKGFILVRRDDFLVCLNIDRPIPPNLIPNVTPAELPQRGKNELLTVVFPMPGVDVAAVAVEVDQIKGPQGTVVGLKSTNSLLVTDIGSNLRRIDALLKSLAASSGPTDRTFTAYPLKFVQATEAEQIVRSLLGIPAVAPNVSSVNERGRSAPSPAPAAGMGTTNITADTRTSQLLVTATAAEHLIIRDALKTVDVEGNGVAGDGKAYLASYAVTSGDPREMAKTLDALLPGVVVNEEGRNGRIHIFGTAAQHQEAQALIQQLDGVGGAKQVAVVALSRMDPVSAASTLRSMFVADGTNAPTIEPDLISRQVMIRGTQEQLLQVKTLLTQLGEDGSGMRGTEERGPVRSIPLSGRDPEELLGVLQRMWGASSDTPLRVITPRDRSPIRGVQTPGNPATNRQRDAQPLSEPSTRSIPATSEMTVRNTSLQQEASQDGAQTSQADAGEPENSQEGPVIPDPATSSTTATNQEAPAGITMTIVGDELVIASSDPASLDRLEDMLMTAMRVVPPRTTWSVYTLQTADATEVATMLGQLIPDSSVQASSSSSSGMFGAMSSFSNSLVDMTGLNNLGASTSLKIIPEPRLNALFVTGPAEKVRDVEEMLRVLDASEWPDSLRDRVPRMIPVEHADVNEVYTIVRDVYKDLLEVDQGANQARQGAQALAMMMGGGRGGNDRNRTQPEVKMTLSKDDRTNNLIVSANDALVREVSELVKSIDTAALEARRTVRVVPLDNANSAMIQTALGSLMPRVKVSTTRSSTSQSNSSSSSSNNATPQPSPGGQSPDDMRRFFEDRMRQRMQEGGGGSRGGFTPGGGGPSGGFRGGFPGGGGGRGGRGR